ncbi:hypothetical protein SAMN05216431_10935 [Ligilactobacillus sp. WC1T17]|uniref:DUF951 domain-containing protein n=1 Tax=Ligilactobacillus ruminis TaxID=1623 RepID=A0ABY1ACH5_9LACO|nr:hypothetical protein SAMN05216431_10935 [Ligilactobacillus ruminis]
MYNLHDIVEMKKPHPCGANRWEIIRMGMDIKIQCTSCQRIIMLPRREFEKKLKKVLETANKD